MSKKFILHGNKVYGQEVSRYGLKNGYLDYQTLAKILDGCILNNNIRQATGYHEWELASGEDCFGLDKDGRECDLYSEECIEHVPYEIFQEYIISESGAKFLFEHTDEIVYYNVELDLYLWAVTHFGTSWDYVLTSIRLVPSEHMQAERDRVRERVGAEMRKRLFERYSVELAKKERERLYEYYIQGRIDEHELKEMLDSLK